MGKQKTKDTNQGIGKIKAICLIAGIVVAVVALAFCGKTAFSKYRAGALFRVNSINDQTIQVEAHRARKGEAGGALTVKEGQKLVVETDFEGKGAVSVMVYPNMLATPESEPENTEKATEEATESADVLPDDIAEIPADAQDAIDQAMPEFELIMEETFQGKETASFDLEPGEYFLWFRVAKKPTGTMTVKVK